MFGITSVTPMFCGCSVVEPTTLDLSLFFFFVSDSLEDSLITSVTF